MIKLKTNAITTTTTSSKNERFLKVVVARRSHQAKVGVVIAAVNRLADDLRRITIRSSKKNGWRAGTCSVKQIAGATISRAAFIVAATISTADPTTATVSTGVPYASHVVNTVTAGTVA